MRSSVAAAGNSASATSWSHCPRSDRGDAVVIPYWLSRVRLKREASAAALAPVLLPADPDARAGVAHRLLWTLFADAPDRRRDFLWREESRNSLRPGRASFLVLSMRPPADHHDLFELDSKPFEPNLASGDRLAFALRANPVVTRVDSEAGRPRRHDVVMDRLHGLPTRISHAAVGLAARAGTLLVWVGEAGVRLYASGQPGGARADRLLSPHPRG